MRKGMTSPPCRSFLPPPLLLLLLLLLLPPLLAAAAASTAYVHLINEKVVRKVDLAGNSAVEKVGVRVSNPGPSDSSFYEVALLNSRAALLGDVILFEEDQEEPRAFDIQHSTEEHTIYRVALSIPAGSSKKIRVEFSFVHLFRPKPSSIQQGDRLYVVVEDSSLWYSPYESKTQSTTFRLGTTDIPSYTEPAQRRKTTVSYGPFEATAAFSESAVSLRFFHDKALITATTLIKEIEVSHWGNVAVEEHYRVQNSGAKLRGGVSRGFYEDSSKTGAFHWMHAHFPRNAEDLYFRDMIGNVSTSFVRQQRQEVHAEFAPRFPLYGGWKADFYLGYNLPSQTALYRSAEDDESFTLEMLFGTPFDDIIIDEFMVRIILPEGASHIEWASPFPDVSASDVLRRFTYMDTLGRPVLELTKNNVVSSRHTQKFQVHYHFPSWGLLREPFLLFSGFLLFFVVSAIYFSIDLSLSTSASSLASERKKEPNSIFDHTLETFNLLSRSILEEAKAPVLQKLHTKLKQHLSVLSNSHDVSDIQSALKSVWKNRSRASQSPFQSALHEAELAFQRCVEDRS